MTLYQDKHTPVLDLLVREAVQNSLDAGNSTDKHAEQKDFVEISFLSGSFCPSSLNETLEGSTDSLNKRFPSSSAQFLAIKDKYTVGLTGPLQIKDVQNYQYGNLLKLVYDICKPQEGAGAGGSWGIGKTIYFRIGQGLVIYYSRIYNEMTHDFQSRLAVSMVEDEHSSNAIIPKISGSSNTGIAWWGNRIGENSTEPVTEESYILAFLKIFGIEPFTGKETGTIVLVPYINEEALIANNRFEDSDISEERDEEVPSWRRTLDEYIKVAVQRWYFPRLNNRLYKYGKYLKVVVNDEKLVKSEMLPVFRLGQALYNTAVGGSISIEKDFYEENGIKAAVERLTVRKHFESDTCPGYIAYVETNKDFMGMCPPTNCYSPYNYLDVEESEGDSNPLIFGYCRRPGMIVSYRGDDRWLSFVPNSDKDKFIVAMFVLNSENKLADIDMNLEEYVRKSEMANHNSWEDYPLDGKTRDIISKIKKNTAQKLRKAFEVTEEKKEVKVNTGLGQKIADLILPREGFGKRPRTKAKGGRKNLDFTNHKGISIALLEDETVYLGDTLEVSYMVKAKTKTNEIILNNYISSDSSPIHPNEWEENGLDLPFKIEKSLIRIEQLDGKDSTLAYSLIDNDNIVDDRLNCEWNKTRSGAAYGINLKFQDAHSFNMIISFTLQLLARNVKTTVKPL